MPNEVSYKKFVKKIQRQRDLENKFYAFWKMNVVNLQLDGKNFLQVFIDQATGQARLAGATRLFK